MRIRRIEWGAGEVDEVAAGIATEARVWAVEQAVPIDLTEIEAAVATGGDAALAELTRRYDATESGEAGWKLRITREECEAALAELDPELREALEVAIANVRAVAEAQISDAAAEVDLPQGQRVTMREVPVGAAGIYAPGGAIAYPSSLIMGAVPARAAGVDRLVVCTPPRPDGSLPEAIRAAAALCQVDELYAVGGAQAIFAMARGTASIAPVDVIAGPGSSRVQEAKRAVFGEVGIDSIAGPSELMVVAGPESSVQWIALDICAQAEHGSEGLLLVASTEETVLERIAEATEQAAAARPGVTEAPLVLVRVPGTEEARALAQAVAPEHLELDLDREAKSTDRPGPKTRELAAAMSTPGCVFIGPYGATAFGDYAAGSNHVLPTGGAGRFCGPLGPSVFRRRVSNVEIGAVAAAKLAPRVDRLARAEGLPVHGESALARSEGIKGRN